MTTSFNCSCIASLLGLNIITDFIPKLTIYIPDYFYDLCIYRASLVTQLVKSLPIMRERQVQSLGQGDTLEKEIATHSSIYAWRIPRTEEPGGLQPMGSQRVRHDSLSLLPLTNVHLLIITCIIVHQKF